MQEKRLYIADLTPDNAPHVAVIISKAHPEKGCKSFRYRNKEIDGGQYAHTYEAGTQKAVIYDNDMKDWGVVAYFGTITITNASKDETR